MHCGNRPERPISTCESRTRYLFARRDCRSNRSRFFRLHSQRFGQRQEWNRTASRAKRCPLLKEQRTMIALQYNDEHTVVRGQGICRPNSHSKLRLQKKSTRIVFPDPVPVERLDVPKQQATNWLPWFAASLVTLLALFAIGDVAYYSYQ